MAEIFYQNGESKKVKNLGWILRNWKQIDRFYWYDLPIGNEYDGIFLARMRNGSTFYITFADYTIFVRFLNRPIFRGLSLTISKRRNGRSYDFIVGQYEKMMKGW